MNKGIFSKKSWLYLTMVAMFALCLPMTSCSEDDDDYTDPKLELSDSRILIDQTAGATGEFTIETTRSWSITKGEGADWMTIRPTQGEPGNNKITVTVLANEGKARSAILTVKASSLTETIEIAQKSVDGKDEEFVTVAQLYEIFKTAQSEGKTETESDNTVTYTIPGDYSGKLVAVVTSDNVGGNANSKAAGYLQDATAGIAFRSSESNHGIAMSKQISIPVAGTTLQKYKGTYALQFSFSTANAVISDGKMPEPVELTLDQLYADGQADGKYESMLIKVSSVQFDSYTGILYPAGTTTTFYYHDLSACESTNTLTVPVSKYATDMMGNAVPKGNGTIVGHGGTNVFNNKTTWYVYPRNMADLAGISDNEADRCGTSGGEGIPPSATKIDISTVVAAFQEGKAYEGDNYIEGEVILNPAKGNVPTFVVYISDGTAGMALTFKESKDEIEKALPLGAKVKVYAKGAIYTKFNGLIQFGSNNSLSTAVTEISEPVALQPLQPRVVTMAEIAEGKYISELVAIEGVQFVDKSLTYNGDGGNNKIATCDGTQATVYTRKDAVFASQPVMEGNGRFVGVISTYNAPQLIIRDPQDLSGMTGARCDINTIELDKRSLTFTKEAANDVVAITATAAWTASSNQAWCTVTPAGDGNGTITVTVAENASGAERKAVVTVAIGNAEATINVTQLATGQGEVTNLVKNGSFEEWIDSKPANWNAREGSKGGSVSESTDARSGGKSLQIDKTINLSQSVSVEGGKKYKITYYVKQETTNTRFRMWSTWKSGTTNLADNKDVLQPNSYVETVGATWQEQTLELTAPATADGFNFEVRTYLNGALTEGTVYFDDFSVMEIQ